MMQTTNTSFLSEFELIVKNYGDHIAVLSHGQTAITYRQLYQKSLSLSNHLVKSGAAVESVVGLCLDKSIDYIASLLSVWYSGAAFIPLDPALPKERLNLMLRESGAKLAVVQAGYEELFHGMGIEVIDPSVPATQVPHQPGLEDCGDNLAYVIYTSGSTGQPKGVLVEHRGILNFLKTQIREFRLEPASRALFYLSTNFDASISDIGTALLSGATLYIEPPCNLQPGPGFTCMLRERLITHMDVPPSLLRLLDPQEMPDSLETIIIGGEACAPDVVRNWSKLFRVVNVYGPTEATVCSSLCVCDPTTWNSPLVGDPVFGTTYYLLDEELNPVTKGTPAELFIGGEGLARGYLKRPELNASKFLYHQGQRLYRTGDRVVEHENGQIEFLGRIDRQVKVRGLLIEPEEIESRLHQHPDVQQAVVLKRPVNATSSREILVAFVVPQSRASTDAKELRRHLAASLPRWMLPSRFQFLTSIPCTPTGKPDLSALRNCELSVTKSGTDEATRSAAKPREISFFPSSRDCEFQTDQKERRHLAGTDEAFPSAAELLDIWQNVLQIDGITPEDDFFELGGDSFSVIEVVLAAEARGISIPPSLMMTCTRLADLVDKLEEAAHSPTANESAMTSRELRDEVNSNAVFQSLRRINRHNLSHLPSSPNNIFITGATGFLGSRLLSELLQRSSASIYCLGRAETKESALSRLHKSLQAHGHTFSATDKDRITLVHGSLETERFGLSEKDWNLLADSVDTVYHCAAHVNMLLSFNQLSHSNLQGTLEVARLMCEGRSKRLHYASTLSVFVSTDQNHGRLMENDTLESTRLIYGGYAQTKWAAEAALRSLNGAAGPVSYYRFGLITGDSKTGYSSNTDFLSLFTRGIVSLGYAPATDLELKVDITPVDYSAAAMAHISLNTSAKACCSTYHVANQSSLSLTTLIDTIRTRGFSINTVAPSEFLNILKHADHLGPEESAACLALCRCLPNSSDFERLRSFDLFQATDVVFDTTNTQAALLGSGITCPQPDANLLAIYLQNKI